MSGRPINPLEMLRDCVHQHLSAQYEAARSQPDFMQLNDGNAGQTPHLVETVAEVHAVPIVTTVQVADTSQQGSMDLNSPLQNDVNNNDDSVKFETSVFGETDTTVINVVPMNISQLADLYGSNLNNAIVPTVHKRTIDEVDTTAISDDQNMIGQKVAKTEVSRNSFEAKVEGERGNAFQHCSVVDLRVECDKSTVRDDSSSKIEADAESNDKADVTVDGSTVTKLGKSDDQITESLGAVPEQRAKAEPPNGFSDDLNVTLISNIAVDVSEVKSPPSNKVSHNIVIPKIVVELVSDNAQTSDMLSEVSGPDAEFQADIENNEAAAASHVIIGIVPPAVTLIEPRHILEEIELSEDSDEENDFNGSGLETIHEVDEENEVDAAESARAKKQAAEQNLQRAVIAVGDYLEKNFEEKARISDKMDVGVGSHNVSEAVDVPGTGQMSVTFDGPTNEAAANISGVDDDETSVRSPQIQHPPTIAEVETAIGALKYEVDKVKPACENQQGTEQSLQRADDGISLHNGSEAVDTLGTSSMSVTFDGPEHEAAASAPWVDDEAFVRSPQIQHLPTLAEVKTTIEIGQPKPACENKQSTDQSLPRAVNDDLEKDFEEKSRNSDEVDDGASPPKVSQAVDAPGTSQISVTFDGPKNEAAVNISGIDDDKTSVRSPPTKHQPTLAELKAAIEVIRSLSFTEKLEIFGAKDPIIEDIKHGSNPTPFSTPVTDKGFNWQFKSPNILNETGDSLNASTAEIDALRVDHVNQYPVTPVSATAASSKYMEMFSSNESSTPIKEEKALFDPETEFLALQPPAKFKTEGNQPSCDAEMEFLSSQPSIKPKTVGISEDAAKSNVANDGPPASPIY